MPPATPFRTPPEVGFYIELDPFSGSISSQRQDLPRLVRDLLLFLLVKDIVILPPGNLLEHSLTLPACEALAPFVRAGRLTTTTASTILTPTALIDTRAELHLEGLRSSPRSTVDRGRRTEITSIVDRWHAILPSTWSLTRDVPSQIAGFAQGMLDFCEHTSEPSPTTVRLRNAIEDSLGAGQSVDREGMLAHVAALRSKALPRELARLAFVVQSLFLEFGVESHTACTLLPGTFARLVRNAAVTPAGVRLPSVDWDAEATHVARRLRLLGLDRDHILDMPPEVLLHVATSPGWLALRPLLRGAAPPPELSRALAGLFRDHADPTNALGLVDRVLGSLPPVPKLPAPWQLAVTATLGLIGPTSVPGPSVTLDLRTLTLTAPGHALESITLPQAHLLTVLASAGDSGLSTHDLAQLTLDVDRIDAASDTGHLATWTTERRQPEALARARALRVRVLVTRVNQVLDPLGLRIAAPDRRGVGRYALVDQHGDTGRTLHLVGTLWTLLGVSSAPAPPASLSVPQARLWRALAEAAPQSLSVHQLAAVLGKPNDGPGIKQVADTLDRLARKLTTLAVPWRVIRIQRGVYALLPRHTALPSEVP